MVPINDNRPLLFERYPELSRKIAYIPLDTAITKVERLHGFGHDRLFVKRDDQLSPLYGGNKVRKLEFIMGEVVEKRAKRIITVGGTGTNHGLATAIFSRKLGIACTLVLFDQEITSFVRNNLRLFYHYRADLAYGPSMYYAGLQYYLLQRLIHPKAYFLPAGGSSTIGTVGVVNAAFELVRQVEMGEMPPPEYVFCATASNGTMAGLSLGFALAGFKTTVIGVRVGVDSIGPLQFNTPGTVAAMMRRVNILLNRHCRGVPIIRTNYPIILNEYVGPGYGVPTAKGLEAVERFKKYAGIGLEPVYTGKAYAAVLDFIKDVSHARDTVLFWNTFNSVDLSRISNEVNYRALPKTLHHCFEQDEK